MESELSSNPRLVCCIHSHSYELNSRVDWALWPWMATSLKGEINSKPRRKKRSIIFPKKSWQFTDNKEKETVESNDCLYPEGTWDLELYKGMVV